MKDFVNSVDKTKFFSWFVSLFFAGPPAVVRLPFHDIDINDTRFLCTWEYPKDNNGANITMFTVWYRLLLREKWSIVNVTQNRYSVRLNCCLTYEIMVTAWNEKGQSSFDPRTAARVTVLKGALLTFDYLWLQLLKSNLIVKHIFMRNCQYFAQKYYFTEFFFPISGATASPKSKCSINLFVVLCFLFCRFCLFFFFPYCFLLYIYKTTLEPRWLPRKKNGSNKRGFAPGDSKWLQKWGRGNRILFKLPEIRFNPYSSKRSCTA